MGGKQIWLRCLYTIKFWKEATKLITKKPSIESPLWISAPGGLYLEIAVKYKRKTIFFYLPSNYKLTQIIYTTIYKPLKKYVSGLIFGILWYIRELWDGKPWNNLTSHKELLQPVESKIVAQGGVCHLCFHWDPFRPYPK